MNTFKKVVGIALCAALVLGTTGCKEEEQKQNPAITTSNTLDDDIRNPVDIDEFVEKSDDNKLENPNLTYFSHYDMRVAGDIKPGVKLFEETYGGKIEYQQVGWGERISKLQTLISTGMSPDLVDREGEFFPYLMSQNLYTDLSDYIDLSEPQWSGFENLIESYSWEGKHYYYPFTANALPNILIYDADLFRSLGIDNPLELYEKDEWDWNSFKRVMVEFVNNNEEALGGVQGLVSNDIMASTGIPLIGVENGKAVNNINSSVIDNAANFLMDLRKQGLTVRGDGMWSNEPMPLATGKVAFLGVGQWRISTFTALPDRNFEFVPFPRDPSADKYYYNLFTFGYMVPSGAPNPEGAAAFINIMRRCQVEPDLRAVVDESIMTEKSYTKEAYDFMVRYEDLDKYDVVVENYSGFSSELTELIDSMLINVAFEEGQGDQMGLGWTQLRATNEGVINSYLENFLG